MSDAPPPQIPRFRCSQCQRAAIVLDGQVIRACRHDAPVIGEMSARVVAVGGMTFGAPPPGGG